MAIIGPADLPSVLRVDSNPLKFHAISTLGHPVVNIEMTEAQWEQILRSMGDFISQYFPKEEKYAFFQTIPLQSTYDIPEDAYWVRDIAWDPTTTRIDDIFGAESFLFNIGNISGIQNLLTDYHLLQAYRKFSNRILGTEGKWELVGEDGTDEFGRTRPGRKLRLFPTPKGSFPVVVKYMPNVTEFRSPAAREILYRAMVAETKIAVGSARKKFGGIPGPDGSTIQFDGEQLAQEGWEEKKEAAEQANLLNEPLSIIMR